MKHLSLILERNRTALYPDVTGGTAAEGFPVKQKMKGKRVNLLGLLSFFVTLGFLLIVYLGADILTGTLYFNYHHFVKKLQNSITPIEHSEHFMISAFLDHRVDRAIRVISIIRRDSLQPLYCIYHHYYSDYQVVTAEVEIHSDHFGFPFGAADVLCRGPSTQNASHVAVSTNTSISYSMDFLPVRNRVPTETFQYNFTICISSLFRNYNNVLQFAQTMEMYKLVGVQHVVIYNTSCGPDLEKILQHYQREGILEIVSWPVDQFLTPSAGWNSQKHPGDLHYYGQLVTLNECVYRHMYQSRYVLLNDIDEIIMPYKHANLPLMMQGLQQKQKNVGVFLIENHIFPNTQFEESHKYRRPEWRNIPGVNIMEHIYREPQRPHIINPTKLIVNPRYVLQTSVHSTLKSLGEVYRVPFNVCHIIHVRVALQGRLSKEQLLVDSRVWDFEDQLVPNVDRALQSAGFNLYDHSSFTQATVLE
ncbi:hypothetical protein AMEX_G15221 [Astyanax mexicanus]|uniref:Glycosyltransferase family 92 protein n=1 Tax=Astyanax mexicanus TaxID=7994 RepID=A0A8B9LAW2_ASTMX|nr:hypothetical protein AMEX_G15221 [Astyanax mexicanus]